MPSGFCKLAFPLTEAVQSWLALAHRENGADNISLVLMSCQVSAPTGDPDLEQLAFDPSEAVAIAKSAADPKFRLNRAIHLFLFLTTSIGFLAAIAIAISFFHPDWAESWRQQLSPDRTSQSDLTEQITGK